MGFAPADVQAMSLWEFQACQDGWLLLHGGKKASGGDLTDDQLAEMGIEGF
ncbi:hypothetical protein [Gemmobacter lutimaris]|uniref:hypothetical protein n=1 Tax=Gemmobacter lutimaris TaxID=2306023 RepID=UPI0013149686|nr:hypothetical protein [Gemmobacter lutimaris]